MPAASKPAGRRRSIADQLDPNDPGDRLIAARQRKAARQAGREGRDRAATTRGRADLESEYDAGAAEAAGDAGGGQGDEGTAKAEQPQAPRSPAPTGPGRGRRAWNRVNRGSWSSFKPTSPARPPRRVGDAGGFLAGVMLYTATVIYIRYGPEGWKGWLKAKFLNQPMSAADASAAAKQPAITQKGAGQ